MEDIFKKRAQQEFMSLSELFIKQMLSMWNDDEDTQDMSTYFTGIVRGNDTLEKEMLKSWYDNTTAPLNKKVKYCRAVERILGSNPLVYHACEYNDIDGLQMSSESKTLIRLNVFDKYKSGKMTDDDKKIFWKFISGLNRSCFEFYDIQPPSVPTRDDISKNIKSRKSQSDELEDTPSMAKAFQNALTSLCNNLKQTDITTGMDIKSLMSRWSAFANDSVDNVKITVLCNDCNPVSLTSLMKHFPELQLEGNMLTPEIWDLIKQLNGYSVVDNNIPNQMMSKIENLASKLADDIVNGRSDMSNMNLSEIGQQVLSQCNEEEMSQFANNIENLMPALQQFGNGQLFK